MKNLKYLAILAMFIGLIGVFGGCNNAEVISVEYLPGSEAQNWFVDTAGKPLGVQTTIAVNALSDERPEKGGIGDSYGVFGGSPKAWVPNQNPTEIVENALIDQLQKAGFKVIKTSGWNLEPETIPALAGADVILGGRLKAFWVESHAGAWNTSLDSKVQFDLIIADVKTKQIIWMGQISGDESGSAFTYWNTKKNICNSINQALTLAINKVFQEEQPKNAILSVFKMKF